MAQSDDIPNYNMVARAFSEDAKRMANLKKKAIEDIPRAPSRLELILMLPGTRRATAQLFDLLYFKLLYRGWKSILFVYNEVKAKEAALEVKRQQCCRAIQRVARGHNSRHRVKRIKRERLDQLLALQIRSAGIIQTSYKCFKSRCIFNAIRDARLKEQHRKKATLIQKIFRGYYYRIDSKERERAALIAEVRAWGHGKLQNLFERPDMQTIEAQGLLIAIKRIIVTPVRPAHLLQPVRVVRGYREGVKAMKLRNEQILEVMKREYSRTYQERKAMHGEDIYARLKERYEITIRAYRESIEAAKKEKVARERLEGERRRRRKQLMGAVSALQNEAAFEKCERELMLLQDIMSTRVEVHLRHIYNSNIKQNLELMKQEDILAHSCRRNQKDNSIMNRLLEAEMRKVREAKQMGEKQIGLGGKKWKRSLAERNCWNSSSHNSQEVEECKFTESFRRPLLFRVDGADADGLRGEYDGDFADKTRAMEALVSRAKAVHKVTRIDDNQSSPLSPPKSSVSRASGSICDPNSDSEDTISSNTRDNSLVRIKFSHEGITKFSIKLLYLMRYRILKTMTTNLTRTYLENIFKFKSKHAQLTSMRHQLIKNKIKTRRERKVSQEVASLLESQLVSLHSDIVGNFNSFTSLVKELVSIFLELFGLDIYTELPLENEILTISTDKPAIPKGNREKKASGVKANNSRIGTLTDPTRSGINGRDNKRRDNSSPTALHSRAKSPTDAHSRANSPTDVHSRANSPTAFLSRASSPTDLHLRASKAKQPDSPIVSISENDSSAKSITDINSRSDTIPSRAPEASTRSSVITGKSIVNRSGSPSSNIQGRVKAASSSPTSSSKYVVQEFDNFWNIDTEKSYPIGLMSQLPAAPPVMLGSYDISNYTRKVVYTAPEENTSMPCKESKERKPSPLTLRGLARSSSSSELSPIRSQDKKSPISKAELEHRATTSIPEKKDEKREEDSVLVISAFHYFLDEDTEKYTFLSDGILNIRWYEEKVARWLIEIADSWRSIHFPYCLSCIHRISWLASNGKKDEINTEDPTILSKLHQTDVADLFELLISQIDIRYDCWDSYYDRSGYNLITPDSCEFEFGKHPFSIYNRLFTFKALNEYSSNEKWNAITPESNNSNLFQVISNVFKLHKDENSLRVRLIDKFVTIDNLISQFHTHTSLFEQLIFNKTSLKNIAETEMRSLGDLSNVIVGKKLLAISNKEESKSTGNIQINLKPGIRPHQFVRVNISEGGWDVKFPSWMLPAARIGMPAGAEPFWRRLKRELDAGITGGKYARMHRKDLAANKVSRQFVVNLRMKLLKAEVYRSKVVEDELLKNNREIMMYEDVRSKACDIFEKKLFIANNPSIIRNIKRMLSISSDADLRVMSTDEKNMIRRGCTKHLNQKRLRASISVKHGYNPPEFEAHDKKSQLLLKYESADQVSHWVTGEVLVKRDAFFDAALSQLNASFAYSSLQGSFTEELWVAGGLYNTVSVFRVVENGNLNPRGLPLCEDIRSTDADGGIASMAYFGVDAAVSDLRRYVIDARNAFLTSRQLCHNSNRHLASFKTKTGRYLCEDCLRSIHVEDVLSTLPNLKESSSGFWNFAIHSPLGRYSRSESSTAALRIQTRCRMMNAKKFVQTVEAAKMASLASFEKTKVRLDSKAECESNSSSNELGDTIGRSNNNNKVVTFNLQDSSQESC